MDPQQVRTYRGPTPFDALQWFHADAQDAGREGYLPVRQEWARSGNQHVLTVTYQRSQPVEPVGRNWIDFRGRRIEVLESLDMPVRSRRIGPRERGAAVMAAVLVVVTVGAALVQAYLPGLPPPEQDPPAAAPLRTPPLTSATQRPSPSTLAAPTRRPSAGTCHPSYEPCLPIRGDMECPEVLALQPGPVTVVGPDWYGLDEDGDAIACEPEA
jgi:hypothetical protein